MISGIPSGAQVPRTCGEQDGGFQFAGMHIVVIGAGDARGGAGFGPVFATWIEPHADRCGGLVGLLHNVGEYGVTAVGVDDNEPGHCLLGERLGDVGDDGRERGGTDTDRSGVGSVFVRASVCDRW